MTQTQTETKLTFTLEMGKKKNQNKSASLNFRQSLLVLLQTTLANLLKNVHVLV